MPETLPTPIDLRDGRERALKLSSTSITRFEERYGGPIEGIISETLTQRFIQTCLWAGLLWQEPKLTFEAVGEMLDAYREATGLTRQEVRIALSTPLVEACIAAGIFRRLSNGHDPAGQQVPNAQTEEGQAGSSPTGTGT